MAYCTAAQVKAIVTTDIPDADITELIAESDAYLDLVLNTGSLSATIKRMLSRLYTAWRVLLKDPTSESIAGYGQSHSDQAEAMKKEFDKLLLDVEGGITFRVGEEPYVPP